MTRDEARKLAMTEWSLSRAYDTFTHSGQKSFAVLTSWRYDKSKAENEFNFRSFKSQAGSAGHGYVELQGRWTDSATGKEAVEPSVWVNGISLSSARSLASQYNQEAFIYAGPETNGTVTLYFVAGGSQSIGTKFSPSSFAQGFSTWKKRAFHFEWVIPGSPRWMQGMAYGVFVKRFVESLVGREA